MFIYRTLSTYNTHNHALIIRHWYMTSSCGSRYQPLNECRMHSFTHAFTAHVGMTSVSPNIMLQPRLSSCWSWNNRPVPAPICCKSTAIFALAPKTSPKKQVVPKKEAGETSQHVSLKFHFCTTATHYRLYWQATKNDRLEVLRRLRQRLRLLMNQGCILDVDGGPPIKNLCFKQESC